ncbi:MAG: DUF3024 domain-containing protein [Chitinophagaceae bacterium]|nr:MAG: DUF3024 domain-containing protein [Chitinophagaceae bacterium]
MPFHLEQTVDLIEALENHRERNRPAEEIRSQLDLDYRIDGQSVFLFEVRPVWNDPSRIAQLDYAKATFVKAANHWKVFWLRANGKWEAYRPTPVVATIHDFLKLVDEDKHHCFKG